MLERSPNQDELDILLRCSCVSDTVKTLIIYASTSGNTRAVAEYIAGKTGGKAVDVKGSSSIDLKDYDSVVLGSRIHAGKISDDITKFAASNKDMLATKKVALFICCYMKGDNAVKELNQAADSLGIETRAYFNKGKKVHENPEEVDSFISKL
jgi:menaquinone-dependent protoporphyrinogen oxidase